MRNNYEDITAWRRHYESVYLNAELCCELQGLLDEMNVRLTNRFGWR